MTYSNVVILQNVTPLKSWQSHVKWKKLGDNAVYFTPPNIFKKIDSSSKEELLVWLLSPNKDERILAKIKLEKK